MVWLIIACRDLGFINDCLLEMNLVGHIVEVGKDVIGTIKYCVKGWGIMIFKYFFLFTFLRLILYNCMYLLIAIWFFLCA
jgi:hypothetical protein